MTAAARLDGCSTGQRRGKTWVRSSSCSALTTWPTGGGVDTEDSDLTDDGDVPGFGFAASTERTHCWSAHLLDSPKFDPSLYLVAEAGDAVVGAALTQDVGDYGYVRQLAVSPAQRGRGLGLLSGT